MQEFMINDAMTSFGAKDEIDALKPSFAPATFFNKHDLMEQYVNSMDKKLQQATADLLTVQAEASAAKKRAQEQADDVEKMKQKWEKERTELESSRDDLAAQLSQLQMRQAKKATDEFTAYWDKNRQDSTAGEALEKAEKHIKSLQEQNASLCYRLSEMRKDLAKLESAAAK